MDHRQLPPISFELSTFHHSVRAALDPILQRIIEIAKIHSSQYKDTIFQEFRELGRNNFIFASSWDDQSITPDVYRIRQGKKLQ